MTNPLPPKGSSWTADVTEDTPPRGGLDMSRVLDAINKAAEEVNDTFSQGLPDQYSFFWWTAATFYFTGRAIGGPPTGNE